MSRQLLKNQLARALEGLGDTRGGGGASSSKTKAASTAAASKKKGSIGGGGANRLGVSKKEQKARASAEKRAKRNNKHALDAKNMSKQHLRAVQKRMRASGEVAEREPLSAEERAAVRKRNATYYALTGVVEDEEHGEHAARAIGVSADDRVVDGGDEDDDDDGLLW